MRAANQTPVNMVNVRIIKIDTSAYVTLGMMALTVKEVTSIFIFMLIIYILNNIINIVGVNLPFQFC